MLAGTSSAAGASPETYRPALNWSLATPRTYSLSSLTADRATLIVTNDRSSPWHPG